MFLIMPENFAALAIKTKEPVPYMEPIDKLPSESNREGKGVFL